MNIISFLLVGLIAGWIASSLVAGHGLGALRDIIVGIIGAFVGGFVFEILGVTIYGFWGAVGMSVVGAMVFLAMVRAFAGSRRSRNRLAKL